MRSYDSYACNLCGGSLKLDYADLQMPPRESEYQDIGGLIEQSVVGGYESTHLLDLQEYVFSICEPCLRKLFDRMVIAPHTRDLHSDWEDYESDWEDYEEDRARMAWCRFTWDRGENGQRAVGARGMCNMELPCPNTGAWRVYHDDHLTGDVACDVHKDRFARSLGHHTAVPFAALAGHSDKIAAWMRHVVLGEDGAELRVIDVHAGPDGWVKKVRDHRICYWFFLPELLKEWAEALGTVLPEDSFEAIADASLKHYSAVWLPEIPVPVPNHVASDLLAGGMLLLCTREQAAAIVAQHAPEAVRDMIAERHGPEWRKRFGLTPYTIAEQAALDARRDRLFANAEALAPTVTAPGAAVVVAYHQNQRELETACQLLVNAGILDADKVATRGLVDALKDRFEPLGKASTVHPSEPR